MPYIADERRYDDGITQLSVGSYSKKAWMFDVDACLLESVILRAAEYTSSDIPRFLEWGAGLSTLSFTRALHTAGHQFAWVTLEYDRDFMTERALPFLSLWSPFTLVERYRVETGTDSLPGLADHPGLTALVYDGGKLAPFLPGHSADRDVCLDSYIEDPAHLGARFDVIVIDGRKRRRCLLQARTLLAPGGVVILDDASRGYYQCAWQHYPAWQRLGEDLWIGAADEGDIRAHFLEP